MVINYYFNIILILKIGTVNDRLGYQDLAKENYEQALTIYRKLDLESTIEIAATYTNLAETFNDLGEHKSAYDLNSKALKIYRQNFGDIDIQIIKCLLGIGNSFMHLNEFEKSKLYYEDSFNMAIHIYGSNSCALDISKSLAGLGSLYLCLGDFKKSLDFNQQSWKMLIELNEHSESKLYKTEIAMVLNNIGKVYEKFNDYHEAEKFHLESYSIRKEILGDKHPELINSLKNLACIYEKLGEKTKGFEKLQEALVIRRKFFGEDSALVASTLKKLADLNTCASPNEVENKKS